MDTDVDAGQVARDVAGWYLRRHPIPDRFRDDVRSDAALGVAVGLATWDPERGSSLNGYLWEKARWAILDGMRDRGEVGRDAYRAGVRWEDLPASQQRPVSLDVEILTDETLRLQLVDPRAERAFDRVITRLDVRYALRVLSPRQRRVVELRFFHEWKTQDIAAHLGVDPSRVSQILFQSYWKMRPLLS